mmetsp:Transcript_52468/g.114516  ORF Transcript_52468/g.114516 Transcript_52468/m.114516 type:complete len:262 (+) Transcript_52468:180-965(+)
MPAWSCARVPATSPWGGGAYISSRRRTGAGEGGKKGCLLNATSQQTLAPFAVMFPTGRSACSPPPAWYTVRIEREHALERSHVCQRRLDGVGVRAVAAQRSHWPVQQLVHNALAKLLHRLGLLLGQPVAELAHRLLKLARADRLRLVAQSLDGRHRLQGVAPRLKRTQLILQQQLRLSGCCRAALLVGGNHLLEVVHIVHDRLALQLVAVWRHVAWHRDVHQAAHATNNVGPRWHALNVCLVNEQLLGARCCEDDVVALHH